MNSQKSCSLNRAPSLRVRSGSTKKMKAPFYCCSSGSQPTFRKRWPERDKKNRISYRANVAGPECESSAHSGGNDLSHAERDADMSAVLSQARRKILSWPKPANWSNHDWSDEVKGITAAVRCRVEIDFDRDRGVPMEAFLYLRALSCAWTRYRQECAYARRFIHANGCDTAAEVDVSFVEDCHPTDSLRCAVRKLPFVDQWLIRQLFWAKTPQGEIARVLRMSQQAISKRKRKIIGKLREVLDEVGAIIVLWGGPLWSDLPWPVESLLFL
jgi:hypothetical protein